MTPERPFAGAVLLAIGIALGGWFVGHGFLRGRMADRFVTVKGVAEREVEADVALWPIRFVATADQLGRAQNEIARSVTEVFSFLVRHGLDTTSVELQELEVTDALANPYRQGPVSSRYVITQSAMVRSDEPALVLAASQRLGELVEAGVVLSSQAGFGGYGANVPTFLFTRLNDLKPDMIAAATANAREAAEQFASDSRSELGGIRRANQGVFVILPRDQARGAMEDSQLYKIVRVVSTVEYFLND
jgi:hypothetical protein